MEALTAQNQQILDLVNTFDKRMDVFDSKLSRLEKCVEKVTVSVARNSKNMQSMQLTIKRLKNQSLSSKKDLVKMEKKTFCQLAGASMKNSFFFIFRRGYYKQEFRTKLNDIMEGNYA